MVYVKVNAGLCNQMYRFAAAYTLAKEWGEELVIDLDVDGAAEFTYLLDEFKIPSYQKIIYPLRYNVGKEYVKLTPELRKKVAIVDESYYEQVGQYLTIPKEKFEGEFPEKDIYLKGSFFKRQMFEKYLPELRNMFTLKKPSMFVQEFGRKIEHVTAIGVHIRKQGFAVLGDDNGIEFFMAAIVFMRKKYNNTRFFIFSDDIDSVKESLGAADDIFYVDAMNGFRGDIEEFICLTKCHHYILTRKSTYGRMAEILNASNGKTSVLYGENTWNDSDNSFFFLSSEKVQELSRIFKKQQLVPDFRNGRLDEKEDEVTWQDLVRIGLNSGGLAQEGRRNVIFQKVKWYVTNKEYGQAVHLCRLLEEQYQEGGEGFHEYFGDILCKYGRWREAVVEYICTTKKEMRQKEVFKKQEYSCYRKLLETGQKKHFIIAPYGTYTSQYLSQMQMIGIILARMGNDVSFIFKRDVSEVPKDVMNAAMMEWNKKIDNNWLDLVLMNGFSCGRFYYGYQCYDYADILEDKAGKLQKIAEKFSKEPVVVGREPEVFSGDIPYRKVFVDFSPPFDEAHLAKEVGEGNLCNMYETADIVVTGDKVFWGKGKKVIQIDDTLLDGTWSGGKEIPCYEPTLYTEDYLDIALKIALATI